MFVRTDINAEALLPETMIDDNDLDSVSGGATPAVVGAAIVAKGPAIAAGLALAGASIKLYRALSKWYADD